MRSFDPRNIECGTTIQRYGDDKCQSLMRAIPADVAPTIKWGPSGQPKPDKVLPYAYELPCECQPHISAPVLHSSLIPKLFPIYHLFEDLVMLMKSLQQSLQDTDAPSGSGAPEGTTS